MPANATQIVLYTDQSFLAEGLAFVLSRQPGIELAASHTSIDETIAYARDHSIDILLLDLTEEVTISALHAIRRGNPSCRMVFWAGTIGTEFAYQAVEAGVCGILRKSLPPKKFMEALESLRQGEFCFDKDVLEGLITGVRVALSHREGQLVNLLSQGLKNKEIAWTLRISEGTVKVYLSRLFRKLGVGDRFELALYGLRAMQVGYANQPTPQGPSGVHGAPVPLAIRSLLVDAHATRTVHEANGAGARNPAAPVLHLPEPPPPRREPTVPRTHRAPSTPSGNLRLAQ
jgi:DNA-binding NarL/FixJ family response regulator